MGVGGVNSGPCACAGATLLIESSLQALCYVALTSPISSLSFQADAQDPNPTFASEQLWTCPT